MFALRSKHSWQSPLRAAVIVATLVGAGIMNPVAIHVTEAQEDTASSRLETRVPSSDPASEYVNNRLDAAAAAAEAAAASETSTEPPAETSSDTAETSGDAAPETTGDGSGEKSADSTGGEPAESNDGAGEPATDEVAPDGGNGTTQTLSGSDVVVSSVGESNQVDRPGRRGKNK
jgi:hypothetical protein